MKKNKINLSREQLEEAIQLFNRSMDDYLYLFDIQNDYYSISKHAVNRFCLPSYHFCDATKAHNYLFMKTIFLYYLMSSIKLNREKLLSIVYIIVG